MLLTDKEFFTVSELNQLIRDVVNMGFPNAVWVCGEIQQYNRNKFKNHVFFDLCEKDPSSKDILAKTGLVIFAGRKATIEQILKSTENAFELQDDIEVKFLCRVDFYPPHGAMRLIVEGIDPVYTLGKIAQEKQKLIALLKKQGLLDKNKTLELPLVPLNIGLITAYDSAAYNDFLSELKASGYRFKVFLRKSQMQGKGAEQDISQAVRELNALKDLDVIVVTRGGGSLAELSCFDSQLIAQALADSAIPVVSGIGHEINITITDLAAHTYQKTPTAVAKFLVDRVSSFLTDLQEKGYAALDMARRRLETENRRLHQTAMDLQTQTTAFLRAHEQHLLQCREFVRRQPFQSLDQQGQKMRQIQTDLLRSAKQQLKLNRERMSGYQRLVELADPKNTLKRGFSITRRESGELVRGIGGLKAKEKIITQLPDGQLQSQVIVIEKER